MKIIFLLLLGLPLVFTTGCKPATTASKTELPPSLMLMTRMASSVESRLTGAKQPSSTMPSPDSWGR